MSPLSNEQLLCKVCLLTPIEYILVASKYRLFKIRLSQSENNGTYRRRQTRRHLSDFLCLQRICAWKTVYFVSIYIGTDQTSNEQEIIFFLLSFLFPIFRSKQVNMGMGASFQLVPVQNRFS